MNKNMTNCDICEHISITEEKQNRLKKLSNKNSCIEIPDHICLKYGEVLYHYGKTSITPCKECIDDKERNDMMEKLIKYGKIDLIRGLLKIGVITVPWWFAWSVNDYVEIVIDAIEQKDYEYLKKLTDPKLNKIGE